MKKNVQMEFDIFHIKLELVMSIDLSWIQIDNIYIVYNVLFATINDIQGK